MVVYLGANVSMSLITFHAIIQNNHNLHLQVTKRIFFFIADHFYSKIGMVTSFFLVVVSESVHQLFIPTDELIGNFRCYCL